MIYYSWERNRRAYCSYNRMY